MFVQLRSTECNPIFVANNVSPIEIRHQLIVVYGRDIMTVQHVHKTPSDFALFLALKGALSGQHFLSDVEAELFTCNFFSKQEGQA